MSTPIQIRLPGRPTAAQAPGFVLGQNGFRPFFLLAGVFAVLIVPSWLLVLAGRLVVVSSFTPTMWHGHEMLFGYTAAVVAGFLLTATARWTGRETARGSALLALCALWLAGRVVMLLPLPALVVAAVDAAFLPALALVLGRAIVGARSRRNYGVLALVTLLALANAVTHLDALGLAPGWGRQSLLFATDVVVLMMLVVGGRVIPMFTRNIVRDPRIRDLPLLDALATALTLLSAAVHLFAGPSLAAALLSIAAGALVIARARHWGGLQSLRHPMLWVLHAGHVWIALGLGLRGAAFFVPVLSSSATHAFTAGAIGALTLGMMSRVALGHTGRPIAATAPMRIAFVAVSAAALVRVAAPWFPSWYLDALTLSGALWAMAFGLFVARYARILVTPGVEAVAT